MIGNAFHAGARGIVWFALPGPGLRACHTPSHLAALARGESPSPGLRVTLDPAGRVVLRNEGPGDLVLAPGAALHRLALESDRAGSFDAAGPGGFLRIDAAGTSMKFTQKIMLSFPRLHVGEDVASEAGMIPSRDDRKLHWSVDDLPPAPLP